MFDSLTKRLYLVITLGLIAYRVNKHASLPPFFPEAERFGVAIVILSIAGMLGSLVDEFIFRNWLPRLLACESDIESRVITALVYAAVRVTASLPLCQGEIDVLHFILFFLLGCILPPFSMGESVTLNFCYSMLAALPRLLPLEGGRRV